MKKCLSTLCLRQFLLINSRIFLMPLLLKGFFKINGDHLQYLVAEPTPHCLFPSSCLTSLVKQILG